MHNYVILVYTVCIAIDYSINLVYSMCMARINVTINDNLLKDVDVYCGEFKYDRSEFIAEALRRIVYAKFAKFRTLPDLGAEEVKTPKGDVKSHETPYKIPEEYENDIPKPVPAKPALNPVSTPLPTPVPTDVPVVREQVWIDYDNNPVMAQVASRVFCQKVFEAGVKQKCYLIKMENGNGGIVVNNQWYCERCLDALKRDVVQGGGKILPT